MWPFKKKRKRTDQDIIDAEEAYGQAVRDTLAAGNNITLGGGIISEWAELKKKANQAKRRMRQERVGKVKHLRLEA